MYISDLFEAKHVTIDSPEFRSWFAGSKVVDEHGIPLPVYHGTARPDRVGTQFRKNRATAGPMAYFTDNPEIASNYANTKSDTSLDTDNDYNEWFLIKMPGFRSEMPLARAWWSLSSEERQRLTDLAPRVRYDYEDEDKLILADEGYAGSPPNGLGAYGRHLKDSRGNVLQALIEEWLTSGALFGDEGEFLKVLKMAGLSRYVRLFPPHSSMGFVYKVYLRIRNPLISTAIPQNVLDALSKAATRQRAKTRPDWADQWDKKFINPREWIADLIRDIEQSNGMHSWTVIPDWVTNTLESLGYDGIQDVGGKGSQSYDHAVWIPFHETQIKSAISNYGYDSFNKNIHK